MNAIMSCNFFSRRYELDFVRSRNKENDTKHFSINAIHATHLSHKFDNHVEVRCSTSHFTAVKFALHFFLQIRVSCSTHHSKTHYIQLKVIN